jgi:hypothetical protein
MDRPLLFSWMDCGGNIAHRLLKITPDARPTEAAVTIKVLVGHVHFVNVLRLIKAHHNHYKFLSCGASRQWRQRIPDREARCCGA